MICEIRENSNKFNLSSKLVCSRKFFIPDEYNKHLQIESESTNDRNKMNQIFKEIAEMQRTDFVCDFGIFQCIYCSDGFNDLGKNEHHVKTSFIMIFMMFFNFICRVDAGTFIRSSSDASSVLHEARNKL